MRVNGGGSGNGGGILEEGRSVNKQDCEIYCHRFGCKGIKLIVENDC